MSVGIAVGIDTSYSLNTRFIKEFYQQMTCFSYRQKRNFFDLIPLDFSFELEFYAQIA